VGYRRREPADVPRQRGRHGLDLAHPGVFAQTRYKDRVDFTWNQGIRCPGAWVIPKGAKDPKACNQFIASTLKPERQLKLLELLGNGPSNPAASRMAPPELAAKDPSNAANLKVQITRNEEWYAAKGDDALDQWLDGIAG
jgi:putative spermidine/putrescine transport system substrate-binding protein